MFLRRMYGSSMNPPQFITAAPQTTRIHHGGTTNVPNASTVRYGASTFKAVAQRAYSMKSVGHSYCIRVESSVFVVSVIP